MKIEMIKIEDLKPADYNPRRMTEEEKMDLTESIKKFGIVEPILCNGAIKRRNIIIGGHQRFYICKELKWKQMPVVYVKINDINKEKELNLRLNKNLGSWDEQLLADYDQDLLLDVGFNNEDLDNIFGIEVKEENFDVTKEYEEIIDPKTNMGDIIKMGEHKLICGDSTRKETFEQLMNDKKAKLAFTSPPYNMANKKYYANYEDNLDSQEYINFNLKVIKNLEDYVRGFLFWNISYNKNSRWEWIEVFYRIVKETRFNFLENIVWDKGHGMPITNRDGLTRQYENILTLELESDNEIDFIFLGNNKKRGIVFNKKNKTKLTNYWRIGTFKSQHKDNKACFPIDLPRKAIKLMSGLSDIVIDPFGGSGTTLLACEQLKRKCYTIELDPKLCDVIIKRWENFSNQQAELIKPPNSI